MSKRTSTRPGAALCVLAGVVVAVAFGERPALAAEPETPVAPVLVAPAPAPTVAPLLLVDAAPASPRSEVLTPVAGAVTAVAPFLVGCLLWTRDGHVEQQEAGTILMASGLALAPLVAHGERPGRRGAVFGALSAATAAATLSTMAYKDPFEPGYRNIDRVPFGVLLAATLFAGAAGVVDAFLTAPGLHEGAP